MAEQTVAARQYDPVLRVGVGLELLDDQLACVQPTNEVVGPLGLEIAEIEAGVFGRHNGSTGPGVAESSDIYRVGQNDVVTIGRRRLALQDELGIGGIQLRILLPLVEERRQPGDSEDDGQHDSAGDPQRFPKDLSV